MAGILFSDIIGIKWLEYLSETNTLLCMTSTSPYQRPHQVLAFDPSRTDRSFFFSFECKNSSNTLARSFSRFRFIFRRWSRLQFQEADCRIFISQEWNWISFIWLQKPRNLKEIEMATRAWRYELQSIHQTLDNFFLSWPFGW